MQIASSGSLFYGLDKAYDWESQGLLRCVLHKGTHVYEWSGPRLTKVSAVYQTAVAKREWSQKVKLSIYHSIRIPTLTYGREIRIMT